VIKLDESDDIKVIRDEYVALEKLLQYVGLRAGDMGDVFLEAVVESARKKCEHAATTLGRHT